MPPAASAIPAGCTVETIAFQGKVGELTTHVAPCSMHLYVADAVGWRSDFARLQSFPLVVAIIGGSFPSRRSTGCWRV